ncbi:TrmH family RNA methyltransferase [Saccharomonospora cyanea]|uniref:rRNA methylase n=1 Tax=Saccharomonospora cyanea NA-134 TaxID=882082 RepID=H5XQ31_9PSEU|nr:RNA methyltransferase [Saccharomonospora cyanea]EHR63297.1 rRNA methylase [Saccharomonospora cyanea NA-134]
MAKLTEIADAADPRLDDFRDLTTADRRPDRPGGRGLVIAEGVVVVRRLLSSAYPLRAVLGVPRKLDELRADLADFDVPAYATSARTMSDVVGFHLNRGVLAVADRAPTPSLADVVDGARVLAVLEGVNDHENLGAMFRNAAALGVDGVLLGAGCADPLYRRSVRVSMGHVLRVPFTSVPAWPDAVEELRRRGFHVAALTPRSDAIALRDVRRSGFDRIALLLGSEGHGLSQEALDAADSAVRIPMASGVDSLNVATAAAVAFYELTR